MAMVGLARGGSGKESAGSWHYQANPAIAVTEHATAWQPALIPAVTDWRVASVPIPIHRIPYQPPLGVVPLAVSSIGLELPAILEDAAGAVPVWVGVRRVAEWTRRWQRLEAAAHELESMRVYD